MKRILSLILACTASLGMLTGCGSTPLTEKDSGKLKVVTTIFPEYDWVRQILGDKADDADITMLLDNGVDLHSYQPTADDIVKIADCDLFLYVGGESDGWVDDALAGAVRTAPVLPQSGKAACRRCDGENAHHAACKALLPRTFRRTAAARAARARPVRHP